MSILSDILARKKREISSLPEFDVEFSTKRSLVSAAKLKFPSLIAEIKPISPVRGRLIEEENIPALIDLYNRHAQAISVLCDTATFGGGFGLLASVRAQSDLPILAKDFILEKKQIDAAAFHGADAVLLIVSILTREKLTSFAHHAIDLGMDVLLELHEAEEIEGVQVLLESMLEARRMHILLGINNRDLKTQKIDLKTTERLAVLLRERIQDLPPLISESGIARFDDTTMLTSHVQGFLIGSAILQSKNPDAFLHSLFPPKKSKVKFCGMTRSEDIVAAEKLSVDFIGLIFVLSSPRSVTLMEARELRRSIKRAQCVGVFSDDLSKDQIEEYIRELQLDYVQLHGSPDLKKAKAISVPVIQAFRGVPTKNMAENFLKICPYILIDKKDGESEADFDAIAALPSDLRAKIFLAGGLTPDNVGTFSKKIQPFAVDTARGIESCPGIKGHKLMSSFFHALS